MTQKPIPLGNDQNQPFVLTLSSNLDAASQNLGNNDHTQITGNLELTPNEPAQLAEQVGQESAAINQSQRESADPSEQGLTHLIKKYLKITSIASMFSIIAISAEVLIMQDDSMILPIFNDFLSLTAPENINEEEAAAPQQLEKNEDNDSKKEKQPNNITEVKKQSADQLMPPLSNSSQLSETKETSHYAIENNPYLFLPTESEVLPPLGRLWSALEEETWRANISHQFIWQRYKAIQEIEQLRLSGSEEILKEALHDPKFWVKMKALMVLADFGIPITSRMVKEVAEGARKDLINNWILRFLEGAKPGDLIVLAHLIRITEDPRTKISILRVLKSNHMREVDLYLYAASKDKDANVRDYAKRALKTLDSAKLTETESTWQKLSIGSSFSFEEQKGIGSELEVQKAGQSLKNRKKKQKGEDIFPIEDVKLYQRR